MVKKLTRGLIKYGLIPMVYGLIRLYLATVRIVVVAEENLFSHIESGGKAIAGLWHQRLFGLLGYAHRLARYAPSAIISQSDDGDILAHTLKLCGLRPIRGSSTRGGRAALRAILADLKENPLCGHALDGPQGPPWVVKPGLIAMARHSGAAIFPLYISMDRAWAMNSWDRFLIPKPFSRLLIYWDKPIFLPAHLSLEQFEAARAKVETRLKTRQQKLDESWRIRKGAILDDDGISLP